MISLKAKNITGHRFGRLIVVGWAGTDKNGAYKWSVRCDCGKDKVVYGTSLRAGHTTSCGCIRGRPKTHGMKDTSTYKSWSAMKSRCNNPKNPGYKDYGGRGITIHPSWVTFEQFYADMGDRPRGTSIDRIDVNGNYEPGNCRWATPKEQANNRR